MSANRKLLAEIQSTLKKVEEGVILFDEVWAKVYSAGQQSLKEKYEADLKKEIKKLQRLRDQIKVWLGSSEIKDKTQLTEARKTIEVKMEQFKICEKDTKTKAYSKEGLAREARLDPKEVEKEEKINWLNENMSKLNDLIDSLEADLEKFGKGKGKNKEQTDNLTKRIKKYKWHVLRMDQLIKLIDNDDLDPVKIDSIKEDVEYFIENAAEDDSALGVDDEFDIYEELQLDSIPLTVKNIEPDEDKDIESADDESPEGEEKAGKSSKKGTGGIVIPLANIGKPIKGAAAPPPLGKAPPAGTPKLPTNQPALAVAEKKPTAIPAVITKSPNTLSSAGSPVPATQPLPQSRVSEDKPAEAPPITSWATAATQRPTMAQTIKSPPQKQAPPVQIASATPTLVDPNPPRFIQAAPRIDPSPVSLTAETTSVPPPLNTMQPTSDSKISGAVNPEIMVCFIVLCLRSSKSLGRYQHAQTVDVVFSES